LFETSDGRIINEEAAYKEFGERTAEDIAAKQGGSLAAAPPPTPTAAPTAAKAPADIPDIPISDDVFMEINDYVSYGGEHHARLADKAYADSGAQQALRDALRKQHGDTLTVYRNGDPSGHLVSVTLNKKMAQGLKWNTGADAVEYKVPVDAVSFPGASRDYELVVHGPSLMATPPAGSTGKLGELYVPKELADDIERVVKSFQTPEEVGPLMSAVDYVNRVWKSGMTTAPGFHGRNLGSGIIQNVLIGAHSILGMFQVEGLVRHGRSIKGLRSLGREFAGLSDEAATKKFADEVFSQDVVPEGAGLAIEDFRGTSLDRSAAADIPGVVPTGFMDILKSAIPRTRRQANPFLPEEFAPFVASRKTAEYTERVLRTSGYLNLRLKGYSPAAAARKIRAAHVDYSDLSDFERATMRRVLLFAI